MGFGVFPTMSETGSGKWQRLIYAVGSGGPNGGREVSESTLPDVRNSHMLKTSGKLLALFLFLGASFIYTDTRTHMCTREAYVHI